MLIEIDGYRDRMKNRVRSVVRNESKVRAKHGSLDCERNVKCTAIVERENRNAVRQIRLLFGTRARRKKTRLYPLGGEPLLDRALELVILRAIAIASTRWRAMRMAAVVTVVADDRGRWYYARAATNARSGERPLRRTFGIAEGAHARTRAVIRVNGRLAYSRYARVSVTRNVRATTVRHRHLRLWKAQSVA